MNFRIAHVNPDKKLIILYKIHELIQKTLVFPNVLLNRTFEL